MQGKGVAAENGAEMSGDEEPPVKKAKVDAADPEVRSLEASWLEERREDSMGEGLFDTECKIPAFHLGACLTPDGHCESTGQCRL